MPGSIATSLDISGLPILQDLSLTDTLLVVRANTLYSVSGESLRARTRPHLMMLSADRAVDPLDPGFKVDPRGGAVVLTLPPARLAAGNEYQILHAGDPDATYPGTVAIVPASGDFIIHSTRGKLTSLVLTRPGESLRLRAEVVPLGDPTNPVDPNAPTRASWFITGA